MEGLVSDVEFRDLDLEELIASSIFLIWGLCLSINSAIRRCGRGRVFRSVGKKS
jgi:hypothetical protein